jgi:Holliday junction resolvasome RuvABC endonuclease subunit
VLISYGNATVQHQFRIAAGLKALYSGGTVPSINFRSLLAVDPSLTCSGWARFDVSTGRLAAVGKIRTLGPNSPMSERLNLLQERVHTLVHRLGLGAADAMVCEAPTTMRDPFAAIKVEQVRGIFEAVGRARNVVVPGRVNPRSVHFEVLGLTGRQLGRGIVKEMGIRAAGVLYAEDLQRLGLSPEEDDLKKHQDIVDAILIGRVALSRLKEAALGECSPGDLFATKAGRGRLALRGARR